MTRESELLVEHLSKEIELANAQLVEQRTKNNLWVAFGPFLILGGLAARPETLLVFRGSSSCRLVCVAVIAVFAYAGLGLIAAMIERQIWERANKCRRLLAVHTGIDHDELTFSTKGLFGLYGLIFAALGIVFVGLGYVLYSVDSINASQVPAPLPRVQTETHPMAERNQGAVGGTPGADASNSPKPVPQAEASSR